MRSFALETKFETQKHPKRTKEAMNNALFSSSSEAERQKFFLFFFLARRMMNELKSVNCVYCGDVVCSFYYYYYWEFYAKSIAFIIFVKISIQL